MLTFRDEAVLPSTVTITSPDLSPAWSAGSPFATSTTEADTLAELRTNVRQAVQCHFGDGAAGEPPAVIRLDFVRDEVLAA